MCKMRTTAVSTILISSLFAFVQKGPPVFVPLKPSTVTTKTQVPHMEKGSVEGRTYKNASIGLELTVADGLEFQTPELKGTPGTVPLLVSVTALGQQGLLSPRKLTAFYADALAYYPEGERSTEAYVGKVVRASRQAGLKLVEKNLKISFGGMSFARINFRGPQYEAVFVKACEAQAFVFFFASSDKDTVDSLVAATSLKIDPVRSGCPP